MHIPRSHGRSPALVFAVLAACAALLAPSRARAQAVFSPFYPGACVFGYTSTGMAFHQGGGTNIFELPINSNCVGCNPAQYGNGISHLKRFLTNGWVSSVRFTVPKIRLETSYDTITFATGNFSNGINFTGSLDNQTAVVTPSTSGQSQPPMIWFFTDVSVTMEGVNVSDIGVCSNLANPDQATWQISDETATSGVLMGNHDVVYFSVSPETGGHLAVSLRTLVPGTDIDLYLRCNALPTVADFNWRGFRSSGNEYLDVGAGCPAGQTLYGAVNAFNVSGPTPFMLERHRHKSTAHTVLTAGTSVPMSETDMTTIFGYTQRGVRTFFGATEGAQVIDRVDLYNSGNCQCNGAQCRICFMDTSSGVQGRTFSTNCDIGAGDMEIYTNSWNKPIQSDDSLTLAHELGHLMYCQDDEYYNRQLPAGQTGCANNCDLPCGDPRCSAQGPCTNTPLCAECGMTIMARRNNVFNICTDYNHGANKHTTATMQHLNSGQTTASSHGRSNGFMHTMPDNSTFLDYDFDGAVGTVVRH